MTPPGAVSEICLPAVKISRRGHPVGMATYRVIDPKGDVVASKDINTAGDAHAWFVDQAADNTELGWRMECQQDDGEWSFFDDSEGASE